MAVIRPRDAETAFRDIAKIPVVGIDEPDAGAVTAETSPPEPASRFWLIVDGRPIPLMEGANVIGRAPEAAIPLDSPGISRYHARIIVTQGEATLEDVGSKNGTQLNGRRVTTTARLADGDEIRVGTVVLVFRLALPINATVSIPPEGC